MKHKHLNLRDVQLKFGNDGNLQFEGYASVFNGVDSYGDTIAPGAYSKTLTDRERPIALRWNHFGPVIGKYLEITEDERGLYVVGELTKGHSTAENVAASLRHGAISGLSIGYIARDYADNAPHNGLLLKEIELIEISVVEEPADNAARIDTLKSMFGNITELKEVEATIRREFGLSQSESTVIVSAVKTALKHGDRVDEESAILDVINNSFTGD